MEGNLLLLCSKRKLLTWCFIVSLTSVMVIYWTMSTLGLKLFNTSKSPSQVEIWHRISLPAAPERTVRRTVLKKTDLLQAVEKLPFRVMTVSSLLLEDLYFTPSGYTHEYYNNSVIHQPQGDCSDAHSLLMLVPSPPQSINVRRAIRETWGSVARGRSWPWTEGRYPIKLIFVLGIVKAANHSIPQTTSKVDLIPEIASFDDILQFDMIDTYQNLSRKIVLALQWAVQLCPSVRFILKVDQDIFVNVPLITVFLQQNGESNSIYGSIYAGSWVNREGKWGLPKSALPIPMYPIYAAGNAYVLSNDAAKTVVKLAPNYPYIHVEDAFITGILASVGGIDRINVGGFTKWTDNISDSCEFVRNKRYFGNNYTDYDLRQVWRELIDGGDGYCGR